MTLVEWAIKHHVTPQALKELCELSVIHASNKTKQSEAQIQQEIRLRAAKAGHLLWRNNRGAAQLKDGSFVRWGLANDSKQLGDNIKSHDLIGIRKVLIGPEHLGMTIGQFWSIDAKPSDWKFTGTPRELAQVAWSTLVNKAGGCAAITNDPSLDGAI